jgi:hypothetical protein
LKRTLFRVLLAGIPVLLLSLNARSQTAPSGGQPAADNTPGGYHYEVYAGFGYTSLNQVNGSRFGLYGVNLAVTRDWGRYFGLSGKVNYYKPPLALENSTATITVNGSQVTIPDGNPGDPSMYEALVFPEIHANIYGPFDGFVHGGLGVEHSGGENQTPSISFAGGWGGGLTYNLKSHFAIRAYGDRIAASFSLINNTPQDGNSPHRTWNSSGTIGLVYRF